MARWILSSTAAAALTAYAGAGWALTAAEAWQGWRVASEEAGLSIEAESETSGFGELKVSGLSFEATMDELDLSGEIEQVVFTENADGTVTITMSNSYEMLLNFESEDGETAEGTLLVSMPDHEMSASGTPEAMTFDFSAPNLEIALEELTANGEPAPFDITISATGVEGSTKREASERALTSEFTAATLDVALSAEDPEGNGKFNFQISGTDLTQRSESNGAVYFSAVDLPDMLAEGYEIEGGGTLGATTFSLDFSEGSDRFTLAGSMSGASTDLSLSGDELTFATTYSGFDFTATGSEIPFPQLTGSFGEWTTALAMPLTATGEEAPFALRVVLGEVSIGEEIWSMFDPAGGIPRTAATAIVDLSGTTRLLVDLLDEFAMEAIDEPAEIESLTLNEVLLDFAGARFTGTGAFTFDNSDKITFDGMPAPDGAVKLALSGGNTLLDKLVAVGLLPQDSAMMGRMMAGMLAKPGPGPDTLESEITVRPDGTVLANGAPLPF